MGVLNEYIDIITSRVNMLDVLASYGLFATKNKLCCPFHNEKTPSFTIFAENKRYKCFGCGEQGSVIDFVKAMDGVSLYEALQRLNSDFGCGIDFGRTISQRERNERAKQHLKIKREKEKLKRAEQIVDDTYFQACADIDYWNKAKNRYKPDDEMFKTIVEKITWLNLVVDLIEIDRSGMFGDA